MRVTLSWTESEPRQDQQVACVDAIGFDDPTSETGNARLEREIAERVPVQSQLTIAVRFVFAYEQLAGARGSLPCDLAGWIAHTVVAQVMRFLALRTHPCACAIGVVGRQRRCAGLECGVHQQAQLGPEIRPRAREAQWLGSRDVSRPGSSHPRVVVASGSSTRIPSASGSENTVRADPHASTRPSRDRARAASKRSSRISSSPACTGAPRASRKRMPLSVRWVACRLSCAVAASRNPSSNAGLLL